MLRQHRILRESNHVEEDLGDYMPCVRADIELALCQAISDSIRDRTTKPFLDFLRRFRGDSGFSDYCFQRCQTDEEYCLFVIHYVCTDLRFLIPLREHAANWLIQRGLPYREGARMLNQ